MIYGKMRLFDYWLIKVNEDYAQEVFPDKAAAPDGQVKLSIYPTSTGTQDNILYANCAYIGLTHDNGIDDKYVIRYENERLKVAYIQRNGRYKQIYLKRVD